MRGVIASFFLVLLACSYAVEALGLPLAPGVGPVRTLVLLGASIWGAVEAVLMWRREARTLAAVSAGTSEVQGFRRTLEARTKELEQAQAALNERLSARGSEGVSDVIQLLSLLQNKGRFIDFVMDDVTRYSDAQIGAAARIVHQGCAAVMREYFDVRTVAEAQEGANVTLDARFDPEHYRLVGRVSGEAPFRGQLLHRGWLTMSVRLPERVDAGASQAGGQGPKGAIREALIIAPAEVQLS